MYSTGRAVFSSVLHERVGSELAESTVFFRLSDCEAAADFGEVLSSSFRSASEAVFSPRLIWTVWTLLTSGFFSERTVPATFSRTRSGDQPLSSFEVPSNQMPPPTRTSSTMLQNHFILQSPYIAVLVFYIKCNRAIE